MKKKAIAALALCMIFTAASCGNIGKPDPNTITAISGVDDHTTEEETEVTNAEDSDLSDESEVPDVAVIPEVYAPEDDMEAFVEATIGGMSLEEKVGQMFFVRPDALETGFENSVVSDDTIGGVTFVDELMIDSLATYHVGGIALFEKNIIDEEQLKKLTADFQEASELPLFIGVDEIGGDFAPVAGNVNFNVTLFDNMNTISNADSAKKIGSTIGAYLTEYGINLDFAPIADISLDSENVKANHFSADAALTAELVAAEIEGLHEGGVMTAVNHFPGYVDGDAEGENIFYNGSLWEQILERDALPYLGVFDKTDMLMVGHVELPAVVSDGMPASMSKDFIQKRIRDELGYDGVIITDSMAAYSVRTNFFQNECAVNAIKAGADIILTPYDLAETYASVVEAVDKGEISEARIDESVKRILMLKAKYGLFG